LKVTFFVTLVVALVLVTSGSAMAQPFGQTASQTVNFTVPGLFLISVTPATIDLELTADDFTPGTDLSGQVTDATTQYAYVHNSATDAKITVEVQSALPAGVNLSVALSGGVGPVSLTDSPQDARTGIARGAGSGTATYALSAEASSADQQPAGSATVVFTITN